MRTFPNQFPQLPIRLQCLILFRKFCIISIFIKSFQTIRTFPCRCLRSEFFSCPNQNTLCFLYRILLLFYSCFCPLFFSFCSFAEFCPVLLSFLSFRHFSSLCLSVVFSPQYIKTFLLCWHLQNCPFLIFIYFCRSVNRKLLFLCYPAFLFFLLSPFPLFLQNFRIPFLRSPTYFHCCFLLSMIN